MCCGECRVVGEQSGRSRCRAGQNDCVERLTVDTPASPVAPEFGDSSTGGDGAAVALHLASGGIDQRADPTGGGKEHRTRGCRRPMPRSQQHAAPGLVGEVGQLR